jgi:hypothetical protein
MEQSPSKGEIFAITSFPNKTHICGAYHISSGVSPNWEIGICE